MTEFTDKLEEARQRLPLKRLMELRGRAPTNRIWKSFPKCLYRQHANSVGVFTGNREVKLFKCHYTLCPTKRKGLGLLKVIDEEFKTCLQRPGQQDVYYSAEDWNDQRKGELFKLIESLGGKQEEQN